MSWKEETLMSQKQAFILEVLSEKTLFSKLCQYYSISRKTGYKWLKRYNQNGEEGLKERSRKPKTSPNRSTRNVEEKIIRVRECQPAWGGKKSRAIYKGKE